MLQKYEHMQEDGRHLKVSELQNLRLLRLETGTKDCLY